MPFPSLDRALVRVAEQDPRAGMAAIDHLITDYPYQRLGALRAKAILVARAAARVPGLTDLDGVLASLPEGERGFLGHIRELREKASAISRQQRFVEATTRPFFKEQALQMLRSEIHAFSSQIGGFPEPLASEFRRAAESWLRLADAQRREVETLRSREPTPQIFRAGDPVQRDAEAFIPRLEVVGTLENEIMAGSGCPGLLLYGRRRLGKSTAIRNLDGFLPESVSTVVVSMQDPEARISDASWTRLLAKEIRRVWSRAPDSPAAVLGVVPFFQFLSACNEQLAAEGRRLLLCLDEYEELDKAVGDHRFDEGLPAMFRESIQTHRRITWLFAGSHHFGELTHIRWSSFLVSVRTVEITPFSLPETQTLLTNPLQHSRRADARHAIRMFGPAFWGDGGMERIHAETGGWPHLVQLVAATVVDLCNTHGLTHPSPDLLEEALTKSVVSGDTVFAELMLYRSKEYPSAWPYLREFRTRERQPPPEDALRLTLKRHLLIKETDDGQWMLRVPLMARWLRERM